MMSDMNATSNYLQQQAAVGIVVIGRNEGKRLERCLHSLVAQTTAPLVYVDSGSTDGSVQFAQNLGVLVVELDTSVPFTMARGRNTGFQHLVKNHPELTYVQFIDGDCEVDAQWIAHSLEFLDLHSEVVTVCGGLKERFPEATIYNHLADMEWQGIAGAVKSCGGNAMYRIDAFHQAGGFNETLIAGEEPELCVRLRRLGGLIWRINAPMATHDANITRFAQWWKRVGRGGYGYAEGVVLHGSTPQRHYVKELARALIYGVVVPSLWGVGVVLGLLFADLSLLVSISTLCMVVIYAKPFMGAMRARSLVGNSLSEAFLYAGFNFLTKFSEAQGALKYFINRALGRRTGIIKYKPPSI